MTMKAPQGRSRCWWRPNRSASSCPKYVGPKGWVGVRLDLRAAPDWDEMAEMIAESYCLTAPKRLAALVGPPATEQHCGQPARRAVRVRGAVAVSALDRGW